MLPGPWHDERCSAGWRAPNVVRSRWPGGPRGYVIRSYDEGGMDLAPIVAQTINARADAIVLKWLDYLQFIDLLNFPKTSTSSKSMA